MFKLIVLMVVLGCVVANPDGLLDGLTKTVTNLGGQVAQTVFGGGQQIQVGINELIRYFQVHLGVQQVGNGLCTCPNVMNNPYVVPGPIPYYGVPQQNIPSAS